MLLIPFLAASKDINGFLGFPVYKFSEQCFCFKSINPISTLPEKLEMSLHAI